MDHRHCPCDPTPKFARTWMRCVASAIIVVAISGGVVLSVFSGRFNGHYFRGLSLHLTYLLPGVNGSSEIGALASGRDRTGVLHTSRGMQELGWEQTSGNNNLGDGLMKHYRSFAEYALESSESKGLSSLPVPVVKFVGRESALSLPVITIIGVQKGGTTSLRGNLIEHPMLDGIRAEVPFFDQPPFGYPIVDRWEGNEVLFSYPEVGSWEGDGLDQDMGSVAAGEILSEYAKACANKGRRNSKKSYFKGFRTDGLHVDCNPQYFFNPITPYRIKMIRPAAKFLVILRDPTDRYFSNLRMEMCRSKLRRRVLPKEMLYSIFHSPGGAKEYLAAAVEDYEPYSAICRGVNASSSDLWKCHEALEVKSPLYRGLYAEQLERWFRVFGRSQIMVIGAEEMYADFTTVLAAAAEFAGLPENRFVYDVRREHKNEGCAEQDHREGNDYFVAGGRFDTMLQEAELIREWYRPHNERLYKLLGRELMWR